MGSNVKRIMVLHSVPVWLPQTETWLYNQIRYLPAEVDNHIVCERAENLDQFFLPNIRSLLDDTSRWRYYWEKGMRKVGIRRHPAFLVEQVRQRRPQVLHSHYGYVGWTNIGVAKQERLKHVVTFYGVDLSYWPTVDSRWHERYRALFNEVDRVLCEGPHMAQCLIDLGCLDEKIRVHHLGVSVDGIGFKHRVRAPAEPLRVLIAASFREKKGIPYALEALGRLQQEVALEITLIGDGSQAEKEKILAVIEQYDLSPKIRMLGYQPHAVLFEEAYRHHIFLSPSVTASSGDTEGGAPVSIIEMAATGMPVVSTRHCDIPGVIQHGRTGLLAEERDLEGLVRNLRWLIHHPEEWKGMVEAARKHVETEFNASIQGERLGTIYRELNNGKR